MSIFECQSLTKDYGKKVALDRVDLALNAGQIVGLLGPNGSGKTTMIKLAAGLLQPTEGAILIDGKEPSPETKAIVAYLPDKDFLPNYMNCDQLVEFYQDFYPDFNLPKALEMLQNLHIDPLMPLKKMSKGTKEKVQLVLTMSREAKVYLLDEPIAGVDPAARDYILKTIINNYSPDALVIISTHLIQDVENVLDDIVFIKNGNIVMHRLADDIREQEGKCVDALFREVFAC